MTKKCSKCGQVKDELEFNRHKKTKDGLRSYCKECQSEYAKKYREQNKEHLREYHKKWRQNNKEHLEEYYEDWKKKNKEYLRRYKKEWENENRDRVRKLHREYMEKKRENDPKFCLNSNMATAIGSALRGKKTGRHWEGLVGYTLDDLVEHLESRFTEKMTWGNYGDYWHLDHIKPKSWFDYETPEDREFKKCWSLGNLQPLEAQKNLRKNDGRAMSNKEKLEQMEEMGFDVEEIKKEL